MIFEHLEATFTYVAMAVIGIELNQTQATFAYATIASAPLLAAENDGGVCGGGARDGLVGIVDARARLVGNESVGKWTSGVEKEGIGFNLGLSLGIDGRREREENNLRRVNKSII